MMWFHEKVAGRRTTQRIQQPIMRPRKDSSMRATLLDASKKSRKNPARVGKQGNVAPRNAVLEQLLSFVEHRLGPLSAVAVEYYRVDTGRRGDE
jgi:hypothetical protein